MKLNEMEPHRVVEAQPQQEITEAEISLKEEPLIKAVSSPSEESESFGDALQEGSKPVIDEEVKAGLGRLFEKIDSLKNDKENENIPSDRYTKKFIVLSAYKKQLEAESKDLGKNIDIAS